MNRKTGPVCALAACLLLAAACVSCRTAAPLPAADLSMPGWRVLHGQAVWKPTAGRPELAGDLVFATNVNGNFFVQLAKAPFPLVTAERRGDEWQIEFGADAHCWRGRGAPPERFVWFQLPGALLDGKTAAGWHFENTAVHFWKFENRRTGESLQGGFFP